MTGPTEHLTVELAAVWDEMFDAVAKILLAAENIGEIADRLPGVAGKDIARAVTDIFEACAFQDITGQRIASVIAQLSVEGRDPPAPPPLISADLVTANDDDLLNGPQLPGNALSQDAIDDLFGTYAVPA